MLDVLSLVIGLVLGGAVVFALKRPGPPEAPVETVKITTGWRLSEMHDGVLVARDVRDVDVPAGMTVLASGLVEPSIAASADVRQVPPVRAEFALDMQGRALLFLGGVQAGAMALLSTEPAMVQRLENEYRTLRDRSEAYVERHRIGDLAGRHGATVEVEGIVQDVLPFQDGWMVRLEDQGHIIGVLVTKDASELKEERIRVQGRLAKDRNGYTVIEASDIRRLR